MKKNKGFNMAKSVEWLKFKVGMFDGHSFKRIKRAKIDGVVDFRDKLTAVWFELIDLAGKVNNNGFYFNDDLAYTNYEEIAIMIDRTEKEVELCINWFIENGMMEKVNSHLLLSNFAKYQNTEGLEKIREQNRIRQQRYREKQKEVLKLANNNVSNVTNTLRNEIPLIDNNISYSNSNISNTLSIKDNNIEELFNKFWKEYPRKVGKDKCLNWFKRRKVTNEFVEDLIIAINKQKKSKQWQNKQYIPHPYTWLNRGGWNDELDYEETPQETIKNRWENFMKDDN